VARLCPVLGDLPDRDVGVSTGLAVNGWSSLLATAFPHPCAGSLQPRRCFYYRAPSQHAESASEKRSRVMKPLDYDIQEEHNSETKQTDMVLIYNGTSPSQTIRIPMHEAITIMMEWLSGYSQAYPMLLKMNPAYEEFAAKMQRLQDK
jgi:hypothetical protein